MIKTISITHPEYGHQVYKVGEELEALGIIEEIEADGKEISINCKMGRLVFVNVPCTYSMLYNDLT